MKLWEQYISVNIQNTRDNMSPRVKFLKQQIIKLQNAIDNNKKKGLPTDRYEDLLYRSRKSLDSIYKGY